MSAKDDSVDADLSNEDESAGSKSSAEAMESGYLSGSGTVDQAIAAMSLSEHVLSSLNAAEEEKYEMRETRKRGRLLLFCNQKFHSRSERLGSDKDVAAIQEVFGEILKFDITVYNDKTALQMFLAIERECSDSVDHTEENCFAVFILSHGEANGVIFGSGVPDKNGEEDKTTMSKLAEPVQRCQTLVGKPKLFFVQACRGVKLNESLSMQFDGRETGVGVNTLPETADFLFAHSTVEGYYSFRNMKTGSWFIQTLCAQFKDNWQKLEIIQMLTRVCRQMSTLRSRVKELKKKHYDNRQQVSSITTTLTKALYFAPK